MACVGLRPQQRRKSPTLAPSTIPSRPSQKSNRSNTSRTSADDVANRNSTTLKKHDSHRHFHVINYKGLILTRQDWEEDLVLFCFQRPFCLLYRSFSSKCFFSVLTQIFLNIEMADSTDLRERFNVCGTFAYIFIVC